jgi:mycoredoxin
MSSRSTNWSECSERHGIAGRLRLPATLWHLLFTMQLTVYSAPWCPDCREAKRFLDGNKIAYTEINIENTAGAADEVIKHTGKRAIPQFVIDGEWVQPYRPGEGFLYEEMSKLLGIREEP